MRWTKSQQCLIEMAQEPVRGCPLNIVYIEDGFAGVTEAVKFAVQRAKADRAVPYSLKLNGPSDWDACVHLSKVTGTTGGSHTERVWNALASVQDKHSGRAFILWIEEAKLMKPTQRERFVTTVEHVAHSLNARVRVVLMIGKAGVWKNAGEMWKGRAVARGDWYPDFPQISNRLWNGQKGERRGEAIVYSKDNVMELRSGQIPGQAIEGRRTASA